MPKAKSKAHKADFAVEAGEDGAAVLRLKGAWVVTGIEGLQDRLDAAMKPYSAVTVVSDELEALDTAGAFLLHTVVKDRLHGEVFTGQENYTRLYAIVGDHGSQIATHAAENPDEPKVGMHPIYFAMVHLGEIAMRFLRGFVAQAVFMGHVIAQVMLSFTRPTKMRWAVMVNVMQRAGIDAVPIVALTSFFIGAVIGFIGVLQLQQYGGGIFAIDMVCVFTLREFAPLITAVLLAGRSASAFAAEVGAMKMNQEIDAMRVMGIDPYEALIVPRLVALVLMSTFVTFIATIAALFGGMLAIWSSLGAGPDIFIQRLHDYIPFYNFFVGIVRPPFFAATIAIVGCWQGMNVKDDVLSLGRQVTTAVVQSIFLVFMLDAAFAIIFNGFTF